MSSQVKYLTVLMPTYNASQFIGYAIRSILNQTFKEFEFLIIDDGSTDNTEEVVKSFNDSRIVYIKKENSGLASTLNYGLQKATFDWVARMDADDLCIDTRFEKQLKQNLNINEVLCTWCVYFNRNKILFKIKTPTNSDEIKQKLALHSYICHSSVIYNRNFILQNDGYREKLNIFEDYELWLRLSKKIEFKVTPEYSLFIRTRNNSLTSNMSVKKNIIYDFQKEYYKNFASSFNLNKITKEQQYRGWREFFYGDKKSARVEWHKLGSKIYIMPRLMLAYILSFIPEDYFNKIVESRFRYRINFFLYKLFHIHNSLQKELDNLLKIS